MNPAINNSTSIVTAAVCFWLLLSQIIQKDVPLNYNPERISSIDLKILNNSRSRFYYLLYLLEFASIFMIGNEIKFAISNFDESNCVANITYQVYLSITLKIFIMINSIAFHAKGHLVKNNWCVYNLAKKYRNSVFLIIILHLIHEILKPTNIYYMSLVIIGLSLQFIFLNMISNELRFHRRIISQDVSPKEPNSSIWSYLTFSYFDDTIAIGYEKPLFQDDLDNLITEDKSKFTCEEFKKLWEPKSNSLALNLLIYNKRVIFQQTIAVFFYTILSAASPFFMNKIISYTESQNDTPNYASLYAFSIFFIEIVRIIGDNVGYFLGRRIGLRIHSIIIELVYAKSLQRISKKSLKLSDLEEKNADAGKVTNLIAIGLYTFIYRRRNEDYGS